MVNKKDLKAFALIVTYCFTFLIAEVIVSAYYANGEQDSTTALIFVLTTLFAFIGFIGGIAVLIYDAVVGWSHDKV